jgi:hypothetical protein
MLRCLHCLGQSLQEELQLPQAVGWSSPLTCSAIHSDGFVAADRETDELRLEIPRLAFEERHQRDR